MDKDEIYLIQGTHYREMTMQLLEAIDLASDLKDPQMRIGLKPNLCSGERADSGATTHPELVDGVLTYLQEHGFHNLEVLEGSWVGDTTERAVKVSGILDVCQKHDVPFFDTQKDQAVTCDAKGMELKVCREVFQIDYLINLPVVKGHCQTTMTCALKNGKGLIPNAEKRRFHTMGLHEPIAHLNTVLHQDLILADNICGDLDNEGGGNPVVMDRILAFRDPVLCDSFAAEAMGYNPQDIAYIRLAEELGVGSTDVEHARIYDLTAEQKTQEKAAADLFRDLPKPTGKVNKLAQYVDAKDACSACYGSLIYALDRLQEQGLLCDQKKNSLAIGQGYRALSQVPEGTLGIGNCTKCCAKQLGGCPPKAIDITAFLKEEWH